MLNPHIKTTLIFNPGLECISQNHMDWLHKRIVQALEDGFPQHSGTFMAVSLVDENGDPLKQ